jgi:hypothetical protein
MRRRTRIRVWLRSSRRRILSTCWRAKACVRHGHDRESDPAAVDWRRLRRAAIFFLVCFAGFAASAAIGLYH